MQGFEHFVLMGAKKTLSKCLGIQLELSIDTLYEDQINYLDLIKEIKSFGFEIWDIIDGFRNPVSGKLLQFDVIFYKKCYS